MYVFVCTGVHVFVCKHTHEWFYLCFEAEVLELGVGIVVLEILEFFAGVEAYGFRQCIVLRSPKHALECWWTTQKRREVQQSCVCTRARVVESGSVDGCSRVLLSKPVSQSDY